MRVFDCILFNQEHDMLECRLWELGDAVDMFIIVESSTTFMGQPKPHGIDLGQVLQVGAAKSTTKHSMTEPASTWLGG
jgi:hypothetical protein